MKLYGFALMSILFGLFAGCGSSHPTNNEDLENTEVRSIYDKNWQLEKINGKAITYTNPNDNEKWPNLIIRKTDKDVSGFGGCNNFMGKITVLDHQNLQFSQMASTKMACLNTDFNENEYLKNLGEVESYEIEKDRLHLKNKKGKTILTFTAQSEDISGIIEKYWKLKTLAGKPVEMGENQEREVHFILKQSDNQIQGFSGCNRFMGTYRLKSDHKIEFNGMAGTLKACPEVDFNENEFLHLFTEMDHYRLNNDQLAFITADGEELATFEAVYF